jgi:hypothetical protein
MAFCELPMDLHVVEIGRQVAGRRHSPWARCWRHPCIAGMFRFQRPDGKGGWRKLSGDKWTPLWYADQTKPDPDEWCDLMDDDHVTPALLHHISISLPAPSHLRRVRDEVALLAREMASVAGTQAMVMPMARSACDPLAGGPCPWQAACYRDEPSHGIGELGRYLPRAAPEGERSSPQPQPPSSRPSYDTGVASR